MLYSVLQFRYIPCHLNSQQEFHEAFDKRNKFEIFVDINAVLCLLNY